jgi:hypothetical protein
MAEIQAPDLGDEALEHRVLTVIWRRSDEIERLATGALAMDSLIRIAALADEVAVLARALEISRPTDSNS